MLQRKRLHLATSILVFSLLQAAVGDNYTDGNRPYEFGFNVNIEGRQHQHRHEVKDEEGIIKGEFGFVTADDVYHVTVFATDKDGHYNILSTKNIKLKSSPEGSSPLARMGHSLTLPTPGSAALAVTAAPSVQAESARPINSTLDKAPASSAAPNTLPIITARTEPTSASVPLTISKAPAGYTTVIAVTTAATTTAAAESAGPVIPNSPIASIASAVSSTTPIASTVSSTAPVTSTVSPTSPSLQSTLTTDAGLASVPAMRNKPSTLATLITSPPPTMAPAKMDIQTSLPTLTTLIESTARTTLKPSAKLSAQIIPAISTGVITPVTLIVPGATVLSKPTVSAALDNSTPAVLTLPAVTLATEKPTAGSLSILNVTPNRATATFAGSLASAAPITTDKSEITLPGSVDTTTEPFRVIALEPPVNSCAGCSLPTATSETLVINFTPKNNVSLPIPVIALRTNIAKQDTISTPGATTSTLSNRSKQNLVDLVIPKTLNNYAHPGLPTLVEQIPSFGIHSTLIQKPKGLSPAQSNSPDSSGPSIELNSNSPSTKQSANTSRLPQQNMQQNSQDPSAARTSKTLNTSQQEPIQKTNRSTSVQGNSQGNKQNSDSPSLIQSSNDARIPQTNEKQKLKNDPPTETSNTVGGSQQKEQQNSKDSSEVKAPKTFDKSIQKPNGPSHVQSAPQDLTHESDKQNSKIPSPTQNSNAPHSPKSNEQQNLNNQSPTASSKMVGGPNLGSVQKSNGLSSVQSNSEVSTSQSIKQNSSSSKDSSVTITTKTLDEQVQKSNSSSPVQSNSQKLSLPDNKQYSESPSPSLGQPNEKQNKKDKSLIENLNTVDGPQLALIPQPNSKLTKFSKTQDAPIQKSNGSSTVQSNSQGGDQNSNSPLPTQSSKTTPILPQQDSKDQKRTSKTLGTLQKDSIQKSNDNDESFKQDSNSPPPTPSSSPIRGPQRYIQPTPISSTLKPQQVPKEIVSSTLPTQSSNPTRGSMRYVPPNSNGPSQVDIQGRTPKQSTPVNRGPMKYNGPKPKLVSADLSVINKNTDIHALSPGEKPGLPDGLEVGDMSKILYTFNYTVGFHSHFEEGYANGTKKGYYYVTGRNGVRTRIDYVADDTGFHPKVSQDVLDLISDDVPKPETEKDAKFGLKHNEFKWLYYPVESKTQKLLPI